MDVAYDGTVAGTGYTPAATEKVAGTLKTRTGDEDISGGRIRLAGGTQGIGFTTEEPFFGPGKMDQGFVAETVFTPESGQTSMGTLMAIGGDFFVRYTASGTAFEYGYGVEKPGGGVDYFRGSVPLPTVDKEHVFSIAYVPNEDGTAVMHAGLDGVEMEKIQGAAIANRNPSAVETISFGNDLFGVAASRGFKGSLSKTRFAALDSGFTPQAFTYQVIESETCEPFMMDPANFIAVTPGDCKENLLLKSALVRPTLQQLEWQEVQQTAFIHFGINTFYNQEWGHGTEDPARFNPTDLDVDSWIKTLRDNGFRYTVLTVKHHDGFMSYPSRYSDHTVKSSPWKDGKGDLLREFTDAAHKYGMKVGLYMSPSDSNQEIEGVYGNGSGKSERTIPTLVPGDDRAGKDLPQFTYNATDYGAFFLNTLYEVLTEYGQVDEVWFDGSVGNTAKNEIYDHAAFYDMVYKLQPNTLIMNGDDVRWVGNESGVSRENEWGVIPVNRPVDGSRIQVVPYEERNDVGTREAMNQAVKSGGANFLHWYPAEADMRLTGGWFAHPGDSPKSPATLMDRYHETVGRNSVLLLNVPPTTTGQFTPESVASLRGFAAERAKSFSLNHALGKTVTVAGTPTGVLTDGNLRTGFAAAFDVGDSFIVDLGSALPVDRISLAEDTLNHGQTVEKFTVEAKINNEWAKVADSGTVGVLRIHKFASTVTAQEFRVTVAETRGGPAHFSDVALFQQLAAAPAPAMDLYVDCKAPTAGIGTIERPFNHLEQFRQVEIATGATVHFKAGTDCAASTTPFWGYGTAEAPIVVERYGAGSDPLVDGKPLKESFAALKGQGWQVFLEEAPPTTAPPTTVPPTTAPPTTGAPTTAPPTTDAPTTAPPTTVPPTTAPATEFPSGAPATTPPVSANSSAAGPTASKGTPATAAPNGLASTGANSTAFAWAGLLLLGIGAWAVVRRRASGRRYRH